MSSQTVSQVFEELLLTNRSYKFSVVNGEVSIQVDGLMHSLKEMAKR